jgi:hypothetical protein
VTELREPLSQAHLELAKELGINIDPDKATMADVSSWLERVFSETEAADRLVSRETFDIGVVVKESGANRDKLFTWVRDKTSLVPYRGVLRGPVGVLMDRRGNSLDRALLLSELLRAAGITVRLAHATLSTEQAVSLLNGARPLARRQSLPRQPAQTADSVSAYAASYKLDAAKLRTAVERVDAATKNMFQQFEQRVTAQAADLEQALSMSTAPSATVSATAVESARDHWWVQSQQGPDWLDLDPTLPDAVPGRAAVQPAEVMGLTSLPESLFHEVTIRVIVEQWDAGSLRESTALEHRLRPFEHLGQSIVLRHQPLNWPGNLDLRSSGAEDRVTRALIDQKEWLPTLTVGARTIKQSSITDAGSVNAKPGQSAPADSSGGGFGGMLGGLGGEAKPAGNPGALTAEWIEYEVRVPGQAPTTVRRDVLDLVGPAARSRGSVAEPNAADSMRLRRAVALIAESDILPLVAQLSQDFVMHVAHTNLLGQRGKLRELVKASGEGNPQRLVELTGGLSGSSGELYALALARETLSPVRDRVYIDRPNILSYHRRIRQNPSGAFVRSNGVDIVANHVAADPDSGNDAFKARLTQGVVDTAAEALVVSGCGGCRAIKNVSELSISAQAQGTPWVLIRSTDEPGWRELNLEEDARKRVENDLRAGYVVLVPKRPVDVPGGTILGWWRVDPQSGSTLGIMQSGEGQAMPEYVKKAIFMGAFSLEMWSCGGFNKGVSPQKFVLCAACSVYAGTASVLSLSSAGSSSILMKPITAFIFARLCNVVAAFM